MDFVVPAVIVGWAALILGGSLYFAVKSTGAKWGDLPYREISKAMGMEFIPSKYPWSSRKMVGRIDGVDVEVRIDSLIRLTVTHEDLPKNITLGPDFNNPLARRDIDTEDGAFDHAIVLRGDEAEAVAYMTHGARAATPPAIAFFESSMSDGAIRAKITMPVTDRAPEITNLIRRHVAMAREIVSGPGQHSKIPERLAYNAQHEPMGDVRRRNLSLLIEKYRNTEAAHKALREALRDRDVGVRAVAAKVLAETQSLARVCRDSTATPDVITSALHALSTAPGVEAELVRDVVRAVWEHPTDRVRLGALKAAATCDDGSLADAVCIRLPNMRAGEMDAAFALLANRPSDSVRRTLVRLLETLSGDALAGAIQTLGKVGTIHEVEVLLPFTEGLFTGGQVRSAAQGAVARIQGLLGPADAGQVSIAAGRQGEGAVSVVEAEKQRSGQVSSARRPGTQRSGS